MTPSPLPDTPPAHPPHDMLCAALPPALAERLTHLFRASLKNGRIHPLYLPMLRYRMRAG